MTNPIESTRTRLCRAIALAKLDEAQHYRDAADSKLKADAQGKLRYVLEGLLDAEPKEDPE